MANVKDGIVLWDLESGKLPQHYPPELVRPCLIRFLRSQNVTGQVYIEAVVASFFSCRVPDTVRDSLLQSGVAVTSLGLDGAKQIADDYIVAKLDSIRDRPTSSNSALVVLISSDKHFLWPVEQLHNHPASHFNSQAIVLNSKDNSGHDLQSFPSRADWSPLLLDYKQYVDNGGPPPLDNGPYFGYGGGGSPFGDEEDGRYFTSSKFFSAGRSLTIRDGAYNVQEGPYKGPQTFYRIRED